MILIQKPKFHSLTKVHKTHLKYIFSMTSFKIIFSSDTIVYGEKLTYIFPTPLCSKIKKKKKITNIKHVSRKSLQTNFQMYPTHVSPVLPPSFNREIHH